MNKMLHGGTSATVTALLDRASADSNAGMYPAARAALAQAIELDESGAALNAFGDFLRRTGQHTEAALCFRKLLAQAERQSCAELQAVACNNLAVIHRERGERSLATVYQQRSWAIAAELPEAAGHANCDLGNFATDAIAAGNYPHAERLLLLALECSQPGASSSDQAADWGNLGILAALQGDHTEALSRFTRAWRLHHQAGDIAGMGCDLLHLGEICQALGRLKTAVRLLERALAHFNRVHFTELSGKAAHALLQTRRRLALKTFDARRN